IPGLRMAEPGEFTRRAFEHGRIDLTAVEGLADLIAAETEWQRRQALRLADGGFTRRAEGWRAALLRARAAVEADLDFSDEEDVPGSVAETAIAEAARLREDIAAVLADEGRGERIREGFQVAIMGPPNAGKSSLLNVLARRDAAIVTAIPGTTRDIVEVRLDLAGAAVVLADTAGLRNSDDIVEKEGIRRARARADAADLVLWLTDDDAPPPWAAGEGPLVVALRTKADLHPDAPTPGIAGGAFPGSISVLTGEGIAALETALAAAAGSAAAGEPPLITRARHRRILEEIVRDLSEVRTDVPAEIRAEALRRAGDGLGRLAGRIDVEDVLGAIFSSFCIGK
ncbi:MAG TPA: tRNA uridine-5-carboxymethylaminomethyl(34) synthesis GTPase MnmE, partial [Methylomirabilota bacterium]|nr:tRNA uridine-5-carboxymethylaminomethyl(34) synthesis GTPase MnmE [Methylomirabilota bacterium]